MQLVTAAVAAESIYSNTAPTPLVYTHNTVFTDNALLA
jgi:hypothetical protein